MWLCAGHMKTNETAATSGIPALSTWAFQSLMRYIWQSHEELGMAFYSWDLLAIFTLLGAGSSVVWSLGMPQFSTTVWSYVKSKGMLGWPQGLGELCLEWHGNLRLPWYCFGLPQQLHACIQRLQKQASESHLFRFLLHCLVVFFLTPASAALHRLLPVTTNEMVMEQIY